MTSLSATTRKATTMDTPKPPSKRWRATYLRATIDYRSERAVYDAVNELAGKAGPRRLRPARHRLPLGRRPVGPVRARRDH